MASLSRKFQDLIYLISNKNRRGRGRPTNRGGLTGSQDQIFPAGRLHRRNHRFLDVPENILRPIMLDLSLAYELEEMINWSCEANTCLTILSQNIFQEETGAIDSWKVRTKKPDGAPLDKPVHPNVIAIANNLRHRKNGKEYVLGAQRLEQAVMCVGRGDEFVEIKIEREGISRNDWGISKSIYLPRWSIFAENSEQGELVSYRQQSRLDPSESDRVWQGADLARILHFKHKPRGRYGQPGLFAQIEQWRKLKETAADLEAITRTSFAPWIFELPSDKDETYRQAFRAEMEAQMEAGVVTHVYLPNDADMRKAASQNSSMTSLLDMYRQLRYTCLLPGFPVYLISGLALEQGASKTLNAGPALAYGRLISHVRSILAEQIHWALSVEIVMNYGYEFYLENCDFEIEWPKWINQEIPGLITQDQQVKPKEKQEEEAAENFVDLNGDKLISMLVDSNGFKRP